MNLKITYTILVSTSYLEGALRCIQVFVQAASADFPSLHEFSDYAPLHGSYVGMTDAEFFGTEVGSALKDQVRARLRIKWNQLLTATKEGDA